MILHDCQIYDGAISTSDIEKTIDGTESSLLAWYKCDSASSFKDSSTHGNDGTIGGTIKLAESSISVSSTFDLSRKLSNTESIKFDLKRTVNDAQTISAKSDLSRIVSKSISEPFDLKRIV